MNAQPIGRCRYGTPSFAAPECLAVYDADQLAAQGAKWGLAPRDLGTPVPDYDAGKADVWALALSLVATTTRVLPWACARPTDERYRVWAAAWGDAVRTEGEEEEGGEEGEEPGTSIQLPQVREFIVRWSSGALMHARTGVAHHHVPGVCFYPCPCLVSCPTAVNRAAGLLQQRKPHGRCVISLHAMYGAVMLRQPSGCCGVPFPGGRAIISLRPRLGCNNPTRPHQAAPPVLSSARLVDQRPRGAGGHAMSAAVLGGHGPAPGARTSSVHG